MGFPDPCIALPVGASDDDVDDLCLGYTAALRRWIDEARAAAPPDPADFDPRRLYDGSVLAACRIYQEHPLSDFHTVKSNTRRFYAANLKIVERDVGGRQIRNLTIIDVKNWYTQWRLPAAAGGKERVDRAHDCIAVFRTALRFCAALHLPSRKEPHCGQLVDALEKVKFEKGGAREAELTYAHVVAFLRSAGELAQRGTLAPLRALYMSIGVAAQFELLLRQKDIIGEYPKNAADLEKALKRGAATLECGGRSWIGYFTWENIPGWRWRMRTSKSKYRSAADFDLTKQSLLFPLLERVPFEERTGAVIKGEHGFPVPEHSYRKWFRQIARAAGIPDDVWNMDTRAGGATEAEEAQVPLDLISAGLTHADTKMTLRYIRRRGTKLDALADARGRNRKAGDGDAGS